MSRYVNLKFEFLPCVVASIVAMVFLRRICSSHPGDGEQRGQSLAALTARGRGLYCFQPQRMAACLASKQTAYLSLPRKRESSSTSFVSPHKVGHFVGPPFMAEHCVSKQVGRHDAACQGCPRCVSRSPEARCLRVFARAVRVSQPAVLSALLVIQLFGI